jgi:hypothetical protein
MRAKVTIGRLPPIDATLSSISVLADSSQRFWGSDVKEYPVDLTLDHTPPNMKPGFGVKADVQLAHADGATGVPLASIFTVGRRNFVFVRDGETVKPLEVKLGLVNDQLAEVREGLSAGQDVKILQMGEGQELLDRAGIKIAPEEDAMKRPGGPRNGAGGNASFGPGGIGRRGGRTGVTGGAGAPGPGRDAPGGDGPASPVPANPSAGGASPASPDAKPAGPAGGNPQK